MFAQLPFPRASLAVLETFTTIAGIEIDFSELREQVEAVERTLGEVLARMERASEEQQLPDDETVSFENFKEERIGREDERRIKRLFEQAQQDRSKAYELKRELDRLGVFKDCEDRFLDLFKKPD